MVKGYIFYNSRSGTEVNFHYHERYYDFTGFNMNLGFLWHANRMVTIGGVLKTPFTAHVKHKRQDETVYYNPDLTIIKGTYYLRENVRLHMPLSFGFGIALRFSDAFTASLDIYHTQWSKFILEDSSGGRRSPITGKLPVRAMWPAPPRCGSALNIYLFSPTPSSRFAAGSFMTLSLRTIIRRISGA